MRFLDHAAFQTFAPYSGKHAVVVAAILVGTLALVATARRASPTRRRRFDVALGSAALAVFAFSSLRDALDPRGNLATVLPLHWCDVTGVLAVVALLAPRYRLPRTLLHFWGPCICGLAFVGPIVQEGPAHFEFWRYFAMHGVIVMAAAYDRFARDYRPTRADCLAAIGGACLWSIMLQPVNLSFAANYGYVGRVNWGLPILHPAVSAWPERAVAFLTLEAVLMGGLAMLGAVPALIGRMLERRDEAWEGLPTSLPMPVQVAMPSKRAA